MDISSVITVLIPIFTSQLEKSREATDLANIRAAYAECSSAVLTGENTKYTTSNGTTSASDGVEVDTNGNASKEVTLTQKKKGWIGDNGKKVAGIDITDKTALSDDPSTKPVVVTVKSDGSVEIKDKA